MTEKSAFDAMLGITRASDMTLRDWFAGQVLAGLVAKEGAAAFVTLAKAAYTVADQMMEQRKVPKEQKEP